MEIFKNSNGQIISTFLIQRETSNLIAEKMTEFQEQLNRENPRNIINTETEKQEYSIYGMILQDDPEHVILVGNVFTKVSQ